jgi:hypothetical protein
VRANARTLSFWEKSMANRQNLLMTPELLTRKRAEMLTDTSYPGRWKSLTRAAGNAMVETSREWLPTLAAMSLLTDDPKWVARAEVLLQPVFTSGLSIITPDRGKPVGSEVFQLALTYNWLHDRLTPATVASLRATLEAWGQWIWPETNPARVGAWGIDAPWNNYYYEFLRGSWLAGLVLYGDSPVGDVLLNLAQKRWVDRAYPWLTQFCAGGYHVEGTNYGLGCLVSILQSVMANGTVLGVPSVMTFPNEAMQATFQTTTPGMGAKAPMGDQASSYPALHSDTDRLAVLMMATFGRQPGMCRYWLDNLVRDRCKRAQSFWFEYLYYPSHVAWDSYKTPENLYYSAPGPGYISRRSGWEKDAIQLQIVCGPKFSDHQDDAGTVVIARGNDWLAGHAKIWSASGLQKTAMFVNLPTVDGRPQNNQGDKTAMVTLRENTEDHLLVQMDLGRAYDYDTGGGHFIRPLKSFRRTVYYRLPNIVFIHDRIEKTNPNSGVAWNLNHHMPAPISGHSMTITEGQSQANVELIGNYPIVSQPLSLGKDSAGKAITSSQMTSMVTSMDAGQPVDEFLCVYQIGPTGTIPLTVVPTPGGARVGDDEVIFNIDGTVQYVDHRISPRDKALTILAKATRTWEDLGGEASALDVISAARWLVDLTK